MLPDTPFPWIEDPDAPEIMTEAEAEAAAAAVAEALGLNLSDLVSEYPWLSDPDAPEEPMEKSAAESAADALAAAHPELLSHGGRAELMAKSNIFRDAIASLDQSEVEVRDLIERELSGVAASRKVPMRRIWGAQRNIMRKVALLRAHAIKAAFRKIREHYPKISARSAAMIILMEINHIDRAIRSGLSSGRTNVQIARDVVGTARLNGMDGITENTRNAIARVGYAEITGRKIRKKRVRGHER